MSNKQNPSKRHHYVPKVLQKQFCANKKTEQIWFSRRENGFFTDPKLISTTSAFVRNNYNTILKNGKSSDVIEKEHYGPIDGDLGKVLSKINTIFKRGKMLRFNKEELVGLRFFIFEMLKRPPDFDKELSDADEIGKKMLQSKFEMEQREGASKEVLQKTKSELEDLNHRRRVGEHTRIDVLMRTQISNDKVLAEEMKKFCVRWAIRDGKQPFILSSKMVHIIVNSEPKNIFNSTATITMPLTPEIALVLLKDPENKFPLKILVDENHMCGINEHAMRESSEIASHSRELLESLIKRDRGQSPSPSTGG